MIARVDQGFPVMTQTVVEPSRFVTQPWRQFFVSIWKLLGGGTENTVAVSGDLKFSAGGSDQPGWLECNGAEISRATYAKLFLELGTTWGAGDGTTTFNLPDFRGRFLLGAHEVLVPPPTSYPVGATGGAETVTLTVGMLPPHTHTGGFAAGSADGGSGGDGATSGLTGSTGSGDPVPTMPPYAAVKFLIKT